MRRHFFVVTDNDHEEQDRGASTVSGQGTRELMGLGFGLERPVLRTEQSRMARAALEWSLEVPPQRRVSSGACRCASNGTAAT